MQTSEDGFAARAAKLFGSLEGHGAPAGGWSLNTQQGFAAGAEDQDSSADAADDVEAGPQSLPGAAGSDEDEDEYKAKASLAYCAAFEAEAEEDAYDLLAAAEEQDVEQQGGHPSRGMQVLDDNAYDRSHQHQQQHKQHKQQQEEEQEAGAAAMEVEGEEPPPLEPSQPQGANQPTAAAGGAAAPKAAAAAAAAAAEGEAGQQQSAKRAKPRGGVWVPPHRRPDYRPSDEAPVSQQDGTAAAAPAPPADQQQQRRRVRFDEAAVQQDRQQQQWQQQQQRPPAAAQRGGGSSRGRGPGRRGRGVPDHVTNPHKYTVYELEEPLFVGQGGGDVESEAAAGSWQQQRQQWGQQQQGQQPRPGKVRVLDASSRAETEGPVEALRVGAPTAAAAEAAAGGDAAPMEVEEAAAPPRELPAAIKFAPTSAGRSSKAAPDKGKQQPAAARGAFLEEHLDADEGVDGPAGVSALARSQKKPRQYRSKP